MSIIYFTRDSIFKNIEYRVKSNYALNIVLSWIQITIKSFTVNHEMFAMVLFLRNFTFVKIKSSLNEFILSLTDIGKSCLVTILRRRNYDF